MTAFANGPFALAYHDHILAGGHSLRAADGLRQLPQRIAVGLARRHGRLLHRRPAQELDRNQARRPRGAGRETRRAEGVGGSAMIELSKQEQQLVEILREWTGNDEYRLDIERTGGAWEIKLSMLYKKKKKWARGVGTTFNEAWDSMAPSLA